MPDLQPPLQDAFRQAPDNDDTTVVPRDQRLAIGAQRQAVHPLLVTGQFARRSLDHHLHFDWLWWLWRLCVQLDDLGTRDSIEDRGPRFALVALRIPAPHRVIAAGRY